MTEENPDAEDAVDADADEEVEEPAAMKLDPPEVDHIELSQDGGETFEKGSSDDRDDG